MKNIHTKALFYSGTLFLIVLSILAVTATIFVVKGNNSYDENTITVSGTSKIFAQPDVAHFSFNVEETSKNPKKGQEVINKKVSKILKGLKDLGVEDNDIKTESYAIHPKYEWVKVTDRKPKIALSGETYISHDRSKRVQVGYDVSQKIRVSLHDLKKASDALTLFAENGVEDLSGPNFDIEDIDEIKVKARLNAINLAKDKAKRLAKDLEVKLVKIVDFNENQRGNYPTQINGVFEEMAMMDAATTRKEMGSNPELPTGENEVTSTVTLTYKIK